MAKYNSGFKYNSGLIYNDRIAYMAVGNGGIILSGSMVRKASFFRRFFSSLSSIGYISRKTYGTVGNGRTAIATSIGKRTSKTISSSMKAISGTVNRVSTYFRDVGYQFYYNMGLRYNIPIEQNGNVNISGNISKSMQYVRTLYSSITTTGILSRVGFFNRSFGNANMSISSNIRKSISKSMTAILSIDTTLSRAATFFRDTVSDIAISGEILRNAFYVRSLSAYMDISGTVSKARNVIISAYTDITSGIGKSINKRLTDSMFMLSSLSRKASFYRSFSGLIDSSSALEKTSQFIRNIGNGAINISSSISKVISKSIFSTVMISRDAMQFVGSGIVGISSTLTRLKYHFLVTLDGILLPLGVRVLRDSSVDIVPSVRDYTAEIPGKHGEISFKTELGSRAIELHVADEMTPEEREDLKRQYAKHIISEDTKTLVFESDVEKSYDVKYAGKIDPTQYPLHMDFAIPFKMTKPFIDGSYEKELTGSGVIANDGTVETPLIIKIKGQISNPTVVIGDDVLSYNGSLSNEQTLIIDTEKQTVKIGSMNVLDKFSGDFKALQPGKVNVIADENVTIRWRDRWI